VAQSQIQGGQNTVHRAQKKYQLGEVDFPSRRIPFYSLLPHEQGAGQVVCQINNEKKLKTFPEQTKFVNSLFNWLSWNSRFSSRPTS